MSTGLRDRKKLETRRAIAERGPAADAEHGPDGVTIEQISEAADVVAPHLLQLLLLQGGGDPRRRPRAAGRAAGPAAAGPPDEAPVEAAARPSWRTVALCRATPSCWAQHRPPGSW